MKKIYLLAFVLLATTFAFAQHPEGGQGQGGQGGRRQQPSAEEIAQRNTDWMKKDLNLTADQIAPVDSINLVYAKEQVALMQSSSGDHQSMRTAMQDLMAKKADALSSVLTKEQMDLYKQKMSEMGNRMRGGHQGNNPNGQQSGQNAK